jgi:hypothetical protein
VRCLAVLGGVGGSEIYKSTPNVSLSTHADSGIWAEMESATLLVSFYFGAENERKREERERQRETERDRERERERERERQTERECVCARRDSASVSDCRTLR